MAILSGQFTKALESIEPSSDDKANAKSAHEEVRAVIARADALSAWDVDTVLIGSYRRDVSIRRVKDVDVFCRMAAIEDGVAPSTVLNKFFTVLDAEFGTDAAGTPRVRRQARSLTVEFPSYDLHVDVVPARRRLDGYWEIPTRDGSPRKRWSARRCVSWSRPLAPG